MQLNDTTKLRISDTNFYFTDSRKINRKNKQGIKVLLTYFSIFSFFIFFWHNKDKLFRRRFVHIKEKKKKKKWERI